MLEPEMGKYGGLTEYVAPERRTRREVLYNGLVLPEAWPPDRPLDLTPIRPWYLSAKPDPILLGTKRELFVDDWGIESTTMTRTWYQGTQYVGNPVLVPDGVTPYAWPFSDGIWLDPADSKWKALYWYDDSTCAYAESVDGKTFTYPAQDVVPGTNKVLPLGGQGRNSALLWLDLNATSPSRKWVYLVTQYTVATSPPRDNHLVLYYSPDCIHWTQAASSANLGIFCDRNTMFFNEHRKRWVLSLRDIIAPVGRMRRYVEGVDLVDMVSKLTDVRLCPVWQTADTLDPLAPNSDLANAALYTLDCRVYESLLVGVHVIIRMKSGPAGEWNDLLPGFSRDGFFFDRTSRTPVAYGVNTTLAYNTPATWNAGEAESVGGCFHDVGTETWLYSSGINNFKLQAGLWIFRRNGFCSMDAGATEATLVTPRYLVPGGVTSLFVNVNAGGGASFKAELMDASGAVVAAFSKANCNPVTVDSTDVQVTWSGAPSLASVAGQLIKWRFYGTSSKFFTWRWA